jgi:hypothetical protein
MTGHEIAALAFLLIAGVSSAAAAPYIDTSADRVKTPLNVGWKRIGTIRPRGTGEIASSRLTVGCETLDRDYTVFDEYKAYLPPLGVKKIRLQAGWAKCEKAKGVYDWKWLDEAVDFAVANGIVPWLETSYGNPVYPGGGSPGLLGSNPTSPEALSAWDAWVEAMVTRYRGKVNEWEIWNEPDHPSQKLDPETIAELSLRTATIIKRIQPGARIAAMGMASNSNTAYLDRFLKVVSAAGKLDLFQWVSYHSYDVRPEDSYRGVAKLRELVARYSPNLLLRQGENGAPSTYIPSFALCKIYWTEYTQAKYDLRRMLGDLGRDIETSVFTIIDIYYDWGRDAVLNKKGLIEADVTKKAVRPKVAYYAIQNLAAVFDDTLQLAAGFTCERTTAESLSVFGFRKGGAARAELVALWMDGEAPTNSFATTPVDLTFTGAQFRNPVLVDLMTGAVYAIPAGSLSRRGDKVSLKSVPLYDSPMLICDRSLIPIR